MTVPPISPKQAAHLCPGPSRVRSEAQDRGGKADPPPQSGTRPLSLPAERVGGLRRGTAIPRPNDIEWWGGWTIDHGPGPWLGCRARGCRAARPGVNVHLRRLGRPIRVDPSDRRVDEAGRMMPSLSPPASGHEPAGVHGEFSHPVAVPRSSMMRAQGYLILEACLFEQVFEGGQTVPPVQRVACLKACFVRPADVPGIYPADRVRPEVTFPWIEGCGVWVEQFERRVLELGDGMHAVQRSDKGGLIDGLFGPPVLKPSLRLGDALLDGFDCESPCHRPPAPHPVALYDRVGVDEDCLRLPGHAGSDADFYGNTVRREGGRQVVHGDAQQRGCPSHG